MPLAADTISGLAGWYKADSLSLSNNDPVSSWSDSSANGYTLSQGTSGNRPLFKTSGINGLGAVLFDGTDDYMASSLPMNSEPRTFFAVVSMTADGNYAHVIGASASNGQDWFTDAASRRMWFGQSGGTLMGTTASTALTVGTAALIELTYATNGAYAYYLNGTADGSGTTDVAWTASTAEVSRSSFGWPGYIGEVLIYDALLSSTDRQNVESWLGYKWGLGFGSDPWPAGAPVPKEQVMRPMSNVNTR